VAVTVFCRANLKKPAHVGFGTGKQLKDIRKQPVVPSITLTTQIAALALRLAKAKGRRITSIKASDGFVKDGKIVKVRGQEFFWGSVFFSVTAADEDLDLLLGALKLLQNIGIGANTSMGFGYCEIKIVSTSLGEPQQVIQRFNPKAADLVGDGEFFQPNILVRFAQSIFNKLTQNWSSWFRAFNTSPFRRLVYFAGEAEIKNPFAYRGWLRSRLLEVFSSPHKEGEITVCPPRAKPCQVCRLMGFMASKSRVITRLFEKKSGANIVYVIVDDPDEVELEKLVEIAGLKFIREEKLEDILP